MVTCWVSAAPDVTVTYALWPTRASSELKARMRACRVSPGFGNSGLSQ